MWISVNQGTVWISAHSISRIEEYADPSDEWKSSIIADGKSYVFKSTVDEMKKRVSDARKQEIIDAFKENKEDIIDLLAEALLERLDVRGSNSANKAPVSLGIEKKTMAKGPNK